MQRFKPIYKADLCAECQEKFEPLIPENEQSKNERDERLTAYVRGVKREDEMLKIETRRGWCSWGF